MKPFEFQEGDKVKVKTHYPTGIEIEYIVQGGGIVEGRDYNTLFPIGGGCVQAHPADMLEKVNDND